MGATAVTPGRAAEERSVSIVVHPEDPVAATEPARWAAQELEDALVRRGVRAGVHERLAEAPADSLVVAVSRAADPTARKILEAAGAETPASVEALGLAEGDWEGRRVVLACGHDPRGLVYALLELADRVRHAANPVSSLAAPEPIVERPANPEFGRFRAAIPGAYTQSPYPLQYYFELRTSPDQAWLYPGFNADLANQPYFVVQSS